jgi:hypothetical protein
MAKASIKRPATRKLALWVQPESPKARELTG